MYYISYAISWTTAVYAEKKNFIEKKYPLTVNATLCRKHSTYLWEILASDVDTTWYSFKNSKN